MRKHNNIFRYSDTNKRYYTYDYYLRQRYGGKCFKLPVDGGFTCPNIDGTIGSGGCSYCSARGSGDFTAGRRYTITEQLEAAVKMLSRKWGDSGRYIPYFQSYTNTYAPVELLRKRYSEALAFPGTVGLNISTRPDALPDDVCDYLHELNSITDLTVELGLQSCHDATLRRIGRGHDFAGFVEGYNKLNGINVCVHIINGLPGETPEMMLETVERIAELRVHSVKIHLLHVLKNTRLADEYARGEFDTLTLDEYTDIVTAQLERLPEETVICRITGDGAPDDLIAPLWSRKKFVCMNEIDKKLAERDSWQGRFSQYAQ